MSRNRTFKKIFLGLMLFSFIPAVLAADLTVRSNGTAQLKGKTYRCALGKQGVTQRKIEGDLKTPLGKFPLRFVYYRPDKFPNGICTKLPKKCLAPNLGWCDDPTSTDYNQAISLPFDGSYEHLWRNNDDFYDLIIVVGYNDQPIYHGKGSAIFIHIAHPDYRPTYGCIAFSRKDLLEILKMLDKSSSVVIS
jgi:L,D-peptidoglycan transpeptidase YkuD (ErfK/YbiS/YcfS/YnhG family)